MPSIASEIARKAKWYQMVTLKMRVSRTWKASVESVTRKRPVRVTRPRETEWACGAGR